MLLPYSQGFVLGLFRSVMKTGMKTGCDALFPDDFPARGFVEMFVERISRSSYSNFTAAFVLRDRIRRVRPTLGG
jgi:hypothetical protein